MNQGNVKRGAVVLALCMLALAVALTSSWAAAPTLSRYASSQNAVTINNQHTGAWDTAASVIAVHTDSCYGIFTITGIAVMGPNDKLYLGLGNDSANRVSASDVSPHNNLDTCVIGPFKGLIGETRVPFVWQYRWTSTNTQTDITDTFFLNAACMGSGSAEAIALEDVMISVDIADRD